MKTFLLSALCVLAFIHAHAGAFTNANSVVSGCGTGSGGSDPSQGTSPNGTDPVTGAAAAPAGTFGGQASCGTSCSAGDGQDGDAADSQTCSMCDPDHPGLGGPGGGGGPGGRGGGAGGLGGWHSLGQGSPVWKVSEPQIDLWLYDEPLGYQPGIGGRMSFRMAYKQRGMDNVSTNIFSLGDKWTCAWLSSIEDYGVGNQAQWALKLGGQVTNSPDGTTKEPFTHTTLLRLTNGLGQLTGFVRSFPDGGKDYYQFVATNVLLHATNRVAFLTATIDPQGRTNKLFGYSESNSSGHWLVHLDRVTDADRRIITLSYTNSDPSLITSVTDPFGRSAVLRYNASGMLTNITDVLGLTNSFSYDSQNWITNLTTPYGTTTFEHLENAFDLAIHTTRAIRIVDPAFRTNVYMLREASSDIYPEGSVGDLVTVDGYLFDMNMQYRNSFHWGPRQAIGLPADLNNFGDNDGLRARVRHWLHSTTGCTEETEISQVMSAQIEPSPDGVRLGKTTWFSYDGEICGYANYEGTNNLPAVVARQLPDSFTNTTWYTIYQRDDWGRPTNITDTFSRLQAESQSTRSRRYIYNGADLVKIIGPRGETVAGYGYTNHQVATGTNAVGEVTSYTYDSYGRLTSVKTPAGLTTTNIYFASGDYTNFVQTTIDVETGRTNSYTYTNDLVATHTDERGVITSYTYDNLQRLTTASDSRATISYSYDKLDLVKTVDRLGFTSSFVYDNVRRKTAETNALGRATIYNYCNCGSLDSIRDAAGNYTYFYYNVAGWLTNTVYADGYSISREYDILGHLIDSYDGTGHGTTNWYNNQGLLYAVTNSFGLVSLSIFDDEDRATNHVDANSVSINSTFDDLGRTLTRSYPDGGIEKFGYSARGMVTYTNQLGFGTLYTYDEARRKTGETNANNEITQFHYDSSGNLTQLTDAKNQNTRWNYDNFSRVTNKVDDLGTNIFKYAYDGDNRLTNRWTPAKGDTRYSYDAVGDLLTINYQLSPSINLLYDSLNRLTNMVDGVGAHNYSYDGAGQLLTGDGPFADDTVSYSYANRLRTGMSLSSPLSPVTFSYSYDDARRLASVTSPAGTFGYAYDPLRSTLPTLLALPGGSFITNIYGPSARLLGTWLENSTNGILNSHVYGYNQGNQRTQQVLTAANYLDYTYDPIGQLRTASGKESGGFTNRMYEQFGYVYDAAGNLNWRTNNDLRQNFAVNSLNELSGLSRNTNMTVAGTTTSAATNVTVNSLAAQLYSDSTFARTNVSLVDGNNTFTAVAHDSYGRSSTDTSISYLPSTNSYLYDLNGNMLSDGHRAFDYDDENELTRITVTNAWKSEFSYDGKLRRRIRKEFTWLSAISDWQCTNEVHYVYDGNLVLQERWYNFQLATSNLQQLVTYTRGNDLSGSLQGAGGIGGLLARSAASPAISSLPSPISYYHSDGNGNVTCLINSNQAIVAKYLYDPYGNVLSISGPLAEANLYRFSSKEMHPSSQLTYYLYRYYDSDLQTWLTRDRIGERGGVNLFEFVANSPTELLDSDGRGGWPHPGGVNNVAPFLPEPRPVRPPPSGIGPHCQQAKNWMKKCHPELLPKHILAGTPSDDDLGLGVPFSVLFGGGTIFVNPNQGTDDCVATIAHEHYHTVYGFLFGLPHDIVEDIAQKISLEYVNDPTGAKCCSETIITINGMPLTIVSQ